jgi:hypothetical protein
MYIKWAKYGNVLIGPNSYFLSLHFSNGLPNKFCQNLTQSWEEERQDREKGRDLMYLRDILSFC